MQVFKLCLKIIQKNLPQMLIYLFIFLSISLLVSSANVSDQEKNTSFTQVKSDMVFISHETTPLTESLKRELGKVANFVDLPDEKEALQEALFFRTVSYILRIPEGFTESFMNGGDVQLEKIVVPDSYNNTYLDLAVNKYLNTARLYVNQIEGITLESLVGRVESDLKNTAVVELRKASVKPADNMYSNYYFNYFAYALLAVVVLGMSALILVFNSSDLKKRNACSPLSTYKANIQFIGGNLVFTFATWLIMVLFCFVFNFKNLFNLNTIYFLINSFVFAICAASISYLIGNLVTSKYAVPAVSNVVTLGTSFISGVFVPQELLGASVLKIASFTPTYWYVNANNRIAALTQFDFPHLEKILGNILIELGFAMAFFAVALVLGKKRRFS